MSSPPCVIRPVLLNHVTQFYKISYPISLEYFDESIKLNYNLIPIIIWKWHTLIHLIIALFTVHSSIIRIYFKCMISIFVWFYVKIYEIHWKQPLPLLEILCKQFFSPKIDYAPKGYLLNLLLWDLDLKTIKSDKSSKFHANSIWFNSFSCTSYSSFGRILSAKMQRNRLGKSK